MLESVWIVPLCPLVGALLNGFFGRRYQRTTVGQIAIGAVGLSFLIALLVFAAFLLGAEPHYQVPLFTWITSGVYSARMSLLVDGLSCTMMLVVTGVGLLIHIYSTGYMHDDEDYGRYFTYLNLFVGAMLILVLADNYLLMFVGWEGVGLCSYLLIGFWYTRQSAADAGKKAFIVNRIGDFGFLLAVFLMFVTFQSVDMLTVQTKLAAFHSGDLVLTAIALLLFMGAVGKSAQVPLYVWLPDAMEGPTPVSALIHAATMVTAGVYMMARSALLYSMAPTAMGIVAFIGIGTAFFAATMALVATDIKRVLAYSTVSQLGFMVFAVGVGAFTAAIFHLVTHAFFKALLFLGAGSVIHALQGEQDMRRMGDLRHALPTTHWTMGMATLAIAGIFPFAGFWSKDEILAGAINTGGLNVLWWLVGLITALFTSFYMFRQFYMTFYGASRVDHHVAEHLHEAPDAMRVPLILLAVLSVVSGVVLGCAPGLWWVVILLTVVLAVIYKLQLLPRLPFVLAAILVVGIVMLLFPPEHGLLHRLLEPVLAAAMHPHHFGLGDAFSMVMSLGVAVLGWYLAYRSYVLNPSEPERWYQQWRAYYELLINKYYVDEIYQKSIIQPLYTLSEQFLWPICDVRIIDRLVNGVARFVRLDSEMLRYVQTGYVRTYALTMVAGTLVILLLVLG